MFGAWLATVDKRDEECSKGRHVRHLEDTALFISKIPRDASFPLLKKRARQDARVSERLPSSCGVMDENGTCRRVEEVEWSRHISRVAVPEPHDQLYLSERVTTRNSHLRNDVAGREVLSVGAEISKLLTEKMAEHFRSLTYNFYLAIHATRTQTNARQDLVLVSSSTRRMPSSQR